MDPTSPKVGTRQERSAVHFGRFTCGEIHTVPTEELLVGQAVGLKILE